LSAKVFEGEYLDTSSTSATRYGRRLPPCQQRAASSQPWTNQGDDYGACTSPEFAFMQFPCYLAGTKNYIWGAFLGTFTSTTWNQDVLSRRKNDYSVSIYRSLCGPMTLSPSKSLKHHTPYTLTFILLFDNLTLPHLGLPLKSRLQRPRFCPDPPHSPGFPPNAIDLSSALQSLISLVQICLPCIQKLLLLA
jgi:hypothetical protein